MMNDAFDPKFAGFTQTEWVRCYEQTMPAADARATAGRLFAAIASRGSNGYALQVETWALLSLLSPDAEARVRVLTRPYGAQFEQELQRQIDVHRRIIGR